VSHLSADGLRGRLAAMLADHQVPLDDGSKQALGAESRPSRPICVHGESFGTRSSMIVLVPEDDLPSRVYVADGRPCEVPFVDETNRWIVD
jgi:hypothetical protein